jgi:surface protein
LWWVDLILFFVAPSLAVFYQASAFNQDVSKWNMGAVTIMQSSKCTLSLTLPLCGSVVMPSVVVYFEHTTTRVLSDHKILTRFVIFCVFETVSFVVRLWWVGLILFFVAPSLAVFNRAFAFNQDVSKWNTGAVTDMYAGKCTLSPSQWPCLTLLCILNIR